MEKLEIAVEIKTEKDKETIRCQYKIILAMEIKNQIILIPIVSLITLIIKEMAILANFQIITRNIK